MSETGSKLKKLAKVAVLVAALSLAGTVQHYLNRQREVLGLTRTTPLENAPPVLAFTTKALGGFRGLISNALWIRASDLQEQGKYFEMVQLADWITKLQPNISAVWIHQAWNMAYNISIKFNDFEDRWMWVRRGFELIRDEGLPYNPNEPQLYRELAWIFQHKLGHFLDDAHEFYKTQWAIQMEEGVGKGLPNWDELLNPQTPEARQRVEVLTKKLKMDPAWMKKADEMYGPLEWRLPETQAIYWATLGLEKTKTQQLKKEDFIGLRRVIFQSLQLAFMRGRILYQDKAGSFVYGPNLNVIKQASDAYLEQAEYEPQMRDNILNAHKNFVGTAVYHLYTHNRKQAAQQWFNFLKEQYPQYGSRGYDNLDDYALSRIQEDVGETDPNRVKTIILGAFETAFLNYAVGEEDVAVNHEMFARRLWQRYMSEVAKHSSSLERMSMPPLPDMRNEQLQTLLSPDYGLDDVLRARLLTRLQLPADFGLNATNRPPVSTNSAPATVTPP